MLACCRFRFAFHISPDEAPVRVGADAGDAATSCVSGVALRCDLSDCAERESADSTMGALASQRASATLSAADAALPELPVGARKKTLRTVSVANAT